MKRLLLVGLMIGLGVQSLNAMQQMQPGTRIPATAVAVTAVSLFHSLYHAYKHVRGTQQEKAIVRQILELVTGMQAKMENLEIKVNALDAERLERAQRRAVIMQAHATSEARPATYADVREILACLERIEAAQARQVTAEDIERVVSGQLQQHNQRASNQSQPLIPGLAPKEPKQRNSCCRVALPFCAGASVGAAGIVAAGIALREVADKMLIR